MKVTTLFGIGIIAFSYFLAWLEAPITGVLTTDFQWIALVLGAIGAVAWLIGSSQLLWFCGIAGLGLCAYGIVNLTFINPNFWTLVDENIQYGQMMKFSSTYLAPNYGIDPSFEKLLYTASLVDRFVTATYFQGVGMWLCLAGSLLLLGATIKEGERIAGWTATMCSFIWAGLMAILAMGLAGQYYLDRGDRGLTAGLYAEAMADYNQAQAWDPQLSEDEKFQLRLGEVYYHLEQRSHPNALFYVGSRSFVRGSWEKALPRYLTVADTAQGPLKKITNRKISELYIQIGMKSYGKQKLAGPAAGSWERARAVSTGHLNTIYFLARAYFDLGRYEQSVSMSKALLERSNNRLLNAHIHANIGDAYWKLHDVIHARQAYGTSQQLDSDQNYRILKSLGGT